MFTRRRLLISLAVVALGGLVAAAWYGGTKGFTRHWRNLLASEFERRGMEVTVQRLTLDPFHGLVAREVRLYDKRNRRRVIAVINEMLLGVNYAEAMRGGNFLDWVDLREANVRLPIDPADPDGTEIEATKLNARFYLPRKQIYLAHAEAEILGIQVYASGRLLNPETFAGRGAGSPDAGERLRQIYDVLSSLRYDGSTPVLSVTFTGDLAAPSEIAIDARLDAETVRRRRYVLSRLTASASYRRGVLELQEIAVADKAGQLRGAGSYEVRTGRFSARLESSLAVNELLRAYRISRRLDVLALSGPPSLDLTVEGTMGSLQDCHILGHVALERFTFQTASFLGFAADVSWMPHHWSVRDLRLRHASGTLEGDCIRVPGSFRATLRGSLNPRELSPALTGPFAEWLGRFDFTDAPSFTLTIHGDRPNLGLCEAEGEIRFGRFLYDGTAGSNLTSHVAYARGTLSLSPFRLAAEEEGESVLRFDLQRHEVRIEKLPVTPTPHEPS